MKTARSAKCPGRTRPTWPPAPRRAIPGHGAAGAGPIPDLVDALLEPSRSAVNGRIEPRDLGGCTQAGHTATIRMTLVDNVRRRGAQVP